MPSMLEEQQEAGVAAVGWAGARGRREGWRDYGGLVGQQRALDFTLSEKGASLSEGES